MLRLIEFIRNISLLLLFLVIEGAAVLFYANSNSYTQAKIFGATADIAGAIGSLTGGVGQYFGLREHNLELTERVMELESELESLRSMVSDSLMLANSHYTFDGETLYISARVVRNSTNKSKNYILLNRGRNSGVKERMAVITPLNEIVGVIVGVTERYSVAMSLLNREFYSSGAIARDAQVGGLSWNGESRYLVQLTELSKYANIYEGAEVLTTGLSQSFPQGVKVGSIKDFTLNETEGSYSANIELAVDFSALSDVIILNQQVLNEQQLIMERFEVDQVLEEIESSPKWQRQLTTQQDSLSRELIQPTELSEEKGYKTEVSESSENSENSAESQDEIPEEDPEMTATKLIMEANQ